MTFSFAGKIRPLPYALWSLAAFLSQHLLAWMVFSVQELPLVFDWWFATVPLRTLVRSASPSDAALILAFAYMLVLALMLAALAFRRAVDANVSEWVAIAAVVPIIQIPAILILCALPSREAVAAAPAAVNASAAGNPLVAAVQGVIAGVGLTLFAVAASTLVFGVYGFGVFFVGPFLVGALTAYFANRETDLGDNRTMGLVLWATLFGSIGLFVLAMEGAVCIIMAAPLWLTIAIAGGFLGRAIAQARKRPASQALSCFALLPLVFALENVTAATTTFDTNQIITVNAPPAVVWNAILHMETIDESPALPFRLGVAYPVRGTVLGEGAGAVRHGEFSTGTAIERVTEWVSERKLAFVVEKDVPSMRELSPYEHVHAPHAVGYFTTSLTSFELVPLADGRTQVVERTSHALKLEPILYWLPIARWVVHSNNARVLAHIKRQAERAAASGG